MSPHTAPIAAERVHQELITLRVVTIPESADAVEQWTDNIRTLAATEDLEYRIETIDGDIGDSDRIVAAAFGCTDHDAPGPDDSAPWHYSGRWTRFRVHRTYDEHADTDLLRLPHPVDMIHHACAVLGTPVPAHVVPLHHEPSLVEPSPHASTASQLQRLVDALDSADPQRSVTGLPGGAHLHDYAAGAATRAAAGTIAGAEVHYLPSAQTDAEQTPSPCLVVSMPARFCGCCSTAAPSIEAARDSWDCACGHTNTGDVLAAAPLVAPQPGSLYGCLAPNPAQIAAVTRLGFESVRAAQRTLANARCWELAAEVAAQLQQLAATLGDDVNPAELFRQWVDEAAHGRYRYSSHAVRADNYWHDGAQPTPLSPWQPLVLHHRDDLDRDVLRIAHTGPSNAQWVTEPEIVTVIDADTAGHLDAAVIVAVAAARQLQRQLPDPATPQAQFPVVLGSPSGPNLTRCVVAEPDVAHLDYPDQPLSGHPLGATAATANVVCWARGHTPRRLDPGLSV